MTTAVLDPRGVDPGPLPPRNPPAANAILTQARCEVPIVKRWGGGLPASASYSRS